MEDEYLPSQPTSRLSTYSNKQYFDFYDTHHSVFSKNSYYHDMQNIHPWERRPCSRSSGIALSTLRATSCSPRIDDLAKPKIKREHCIRQEFFDNFKNYSYSGVSQAALTAQCSDRVLALSQPKRMPNGYLEAYVLPRLVPRRALTAKISNHVNDLAKPRRTTILLNRAWNTKQK